MRLFAAIVPPPDVLAELVKVVRSVVPRQPQEPLAEGHHAGPRKGLLGRLARPAGPSEPAPAPQGEQLHRLLTHRMSVPLTTFGNLTRVDSELIAEALRREAAAWPRPSLWLGGGTALEFPGDRSVWAGLGGDVAGLEAIAKDVPRVAQRLSLYVDRRTFRPWLALGTITDTTTAPYLEDLVAALEAFRGTTWTQDAVSLLAGQPEGGHNEPFEELERIPLVTGQ